MQLIEILSDITVKLRQGRFPNEQAISQGIVLRLMQELGWDVYDTNIVWPEFQTGEGRADFALCHPPSKPSIFIEVKQPGKAEDGVRQALEYAFHTGVPFIVLTDGKTWSFYLPAEQGSYEDRRVYKLDLFERAAEQGASTLTKYLDYGRVESGEALEDARKEYRNRNRRSVARQAIPDAWHELVENGDEVLVEILANAVESKAGFRPEDDDVTDFLTNLGNPVIVQAVSPRPTAPAKPNEPAMQAKSATDAGPRVIRLQNIGDGKFVDAKAHISEDHYNSLGNHEIDSGDIVIAAMGEILPRACIIPESVGPAIVKADCIRFKPDPVHSNKFLYYALNSPGVRSRAKHIVHGVGRPRLNQKEIKAIQLPVAPPDEQRRIVARIEELFSRLDVGVAALRHAKAQLQRYRQSVLAAAVTGQLTQAWREQHPDTELAEELLERILEDRRETWNGRCTYKEPSPISEVPDLQLPSGWVWCSLDTVSEALGGFAFKSKDYTESGYQIVKMGNVRMHCLELGNKPSFIASVPDDIVEKYLLRPDDLIITLTGTRKKRDYGFVARVSNESDLLLNQRIARVRPCSHVASGFLLLALSAEYFRDQFFASETGNVGQGNVSMKAVTATAFALPPLAEQHQIVAEVESRTTVIDHLEVELDRQITRSNRLRQSTLAEAFLGTL